MSTLTQTDLNILTILTNLQSQLKEQFIPIKRVRGHFKLQTGKEWHEEQNVTLTQYLTSRQEIYAFQRAGQAGEHCMALTEPFLVAHPEYIVKDIDGMPSETDLKVKREALERQNAQKEKEAKERLAQRKRIEQHEREEAKRREEQMRRDREAHERDEKQRLLKLSIQEQQKIEEQKKQIEKSKPQWKDSEERRELVQEDAPKKKHVDALVKHVSPANDSSTKTGTSIATANITSFDSIEDLVQKLTSKTTSKAESARAFFVWVTSNITYDMKGEFRATSPVDILKNRATHSTGYCALFQRMCDIAGISCVTLYGFVRGTAQYLDASTLGHSWNAVRIDDDSWQLVDCVFGAGYVSNTSNGEFVHDTNEYFFFPDPKQFIYSHLPQKDKWQLLEKPITKDEFDANVLITVPGFEAHFTPVSHTKRDIPLSNDNLCQIDFRARKDVHFLIKLQYEDTEEKIEHRTMLLRPTPELVQAHLILPQSGKRYLVKIMCREGSMDGTYLLAAKYVVDVAMNASISLEASGFPTEVLREHHTKCGVEFDSHKYRRIGLEGSNILRMRFKTNGEASLFATVAPVDNDGTLGPKLAQNLTFSQFEDVQKKLIQVNALFPHAGEYEVGIFCKHDSEKGNQYHGGITYRVVVDEAPFAEVTSFPTPLISFVDLNCFVEQPLENPLHLNKTYTVRIRVQHADQEAEKMAFVVNGLWNNFEKVEGTNAGSTWQCELELKDKVEHKCYVKVSNDANFKCILKWNVV
uniref:Transglutaminase-like domain-containing protein n=1 Tax=Percolomonas cosmopolitus TaxID=63605 RepID=A0A7S1KLG3_9EUKA|eukprot:CAMPEP_0117447264 /NCGR_PEP_ID=MMETSP0759-20121206/6780_1 /TAXON_ID=63605 /ORGANISM="Percolomonas cosmopolitus, Strain WS" /LENGTH=751 /DNA_ID=CAMNT_0005239583 /DNA_START=65 /DNA_END=2320 /DNA_ORIENTATION=-